MSDVSELLTQLRDIRLPQPTPEPALWPLLLTLLMALFILLWLGHQWWRRKNAWAVEFKTAITTLQLQPPNIALPGYATMLKRMALTFEPGTAIKSLHGEEWLNYLDRFFYTDYFSEHEGQVFGSGIYQPIRMEHHESMLLGDRLKQLITRRTIFSPIGPPDIQRASRS